MNTAWTLSAQRVSFRSKLILISLLFVLFFIVFLLLWPVYGERMIILISLPVLACTWLLGMRAGLIAWVMSIPTQAVLLHIMRGASSSLFQGSVIGLGMLLLAVVAVGQLHKMSNRMGSEQDELATLEKALRESERFNKTVSDTIPDIVYIFDRVEQRNIYVNRSVSSILGYTPETILKMGDSVMATLTHPDDLIRLGEQRSELENMLAKGLSIDYEYRMRHINGNWRWMRSREVIFSRNEDGSPRQVLGIAHDFTEQKLAAEALIERSKLQIALEKERELASLKTRLMTTISHEFRTPLSIVLASAEMLERYFEQIPKERREEIIGTVKGQILSLREMLNDISTLIGEESSQPVFSPSPLDLATICRSVIDDMRNSVGADHIIQFKSQSDMPLVAADEGLLRPIVRNLLSNAVKYSNPGDAVQCQVFQQGDEAIIEVHDQGIGIPSEDQERIFDTFHRAGNVSHIGGLGLGLKIVGDYVALHGGKINVVSHVGDGTTVTVRLPINPQ